MKPLCGDEPMLEAALATICEQDYPELQIVFGVQDADDPALLAVQALQRRYPDHDISVVIDHRVHGSNRKISNLMNMLHAARHDLLVLSDSDLHVPRRLRRADRGGAGGAGRRAGDDAVQRAADPAGAGGAAGGDGDHA